MPNPAPTRRKRGRPPIEGLAERRSDEILNVATRVFAKHGYSCTDLQIVADRLNIGKGTLYRYFPSKRKLFQSALERMLRTMRAEVDAAVGKELDALDQLYAGVRAYLSFFEQNPECVELLIQERAEFRDSPRSTYFEQRAAHIGRWHDFYRALIKQGRVRDVPVQRITDVLSNAIYGTMFSNYFDGPTKPLSQQAEDVLDITLHGLLTPEESARHQRKGSTT